MDKMRFLENWFAQTIFRQFGCVDISLDFLVIQNSDLIFAKILPGHPLTAYLWSKLALTTKTAHFLGQTIPRIGKSPTLPIFMCYSQWNF
ncbi:hypothetical protein H5410_064063 [Solanum commersonii]|uniref:Uncharacterized protein n=1 Tax=Solanum commersonii TaxID=4109 RepID=A0A9J5W0L5_SOLCO|nr:hypothetical protein H5410_064063 [Solanum commersonii]